MKNVGQPIRDSLPWYSWFTKDPRWLNNVFLFSTEIWAEQLKKAPCILYIVFLVLNWPSILEFWRRKKVVQVARIGGREGEWEGEFGQCSEECIFFLRKPSLIAFYAFIMQWQVKNPEPVLMFASHKIGITHETELQSSGDSRQSRCRYGTAPSGGRRRRRRWSMRSTSPCWSTTRSGSTSWSWLLPWSPASPSLPSTTPTLFHLGSQSLGQS